MQVTVTLGLLVWLAWYLDLRAVLRLALEADPALWALGLGLSLANLVLMAWRWRVLLEHEGLRPSLLATCAIYLQSGFYALFLPSAVGGDIYRALRMRELLGGTGRAAVNLLVERLLGLWVLILWGAVGLLCYGGALRERAWLPALLLAGGAGAVSALLGSRTLASAICRLLRRLSAPGLAERVDALAAQWRGYLQRPGILLRATAVTALSQAVAIVSVWVLGLSLDVTLHPLAYWVAVPVAWLLGLLPSLAGIGPREGGLVLVLVGAGATAEQSGAVAGLMLSVQLARSLLGLVALGARWWTQR